jgi:hypothetical protein
LSAALLPMKRLIGGQFTGLPSANPIWVRGRHAGAGWGGDDCVAVALRSEALH